MLRLSALALVLVSCGTVGSGTDAGASCNTPSGMYQLTVDSPKSCAQGEMPYPDPTLQGHLTIGRTTADGGLEHSVTVSGTFGCAVLFQGCQTLVTCDRNGATDAYTLTTQPDGSLSGTLDGRCACTTRKVSCGVTAKR